MLDLLYDGGRMREVFRPFLYPQTGQYQAVSFTIVVLFERKEKMDTKQINEALNLYIRPQTNPLALKLCASASEVPPKLQKPLKDFGYQVTLCQGFGLARRFGWSLAIGKEDQACIGGASAMGFVAERPGDDPAKRLDVGKYSHILVAPLADAGFEPDIVAIYGMPAQVMRLCQAAVRSANIKVNANAGGGGACGDTVARTARTDECQSVLPSGGDRVFGGTQDFEVVFAIPSSKIAAIVKGLEDTHKAGFRYPVLLDLRHAPTLPPFLQIPKGA